MFFESPCKAKGIERLFLSVVKEKMRDLSSNQINFERERDPVGEKTTKIGTHKGGRRAKRAAPFVGAAAGGRRSYFGGLLSDRVS